MRAYNESNLLKSKYMLSLQLCIIWYLMMALHVRNYSDVPLIHRRVWWPWPSWQRRRNFLDVAGPNSQSWQQPDHLGNSSHVEGWGGNRYCSHRFLHLGKRNVCNNCSVQWGNNPDSEQYSTVQTYRYVLYFYGIHVQGWSKVIVDECVYRPSVPLPYCMWLQSSIWVWSFH